MDLRPLPWWTTGWTTWRTIWRTPPGTLRIRVLSSAAALLLLMAGPLAADPLAEAGASFDAAGRALNEQIGDMFGTRPAPQKPRARLARPRPAVPLPPIRPAELAREPGSAPGPAPGPVPLPAPAPVVAAAPAPAPAPSAVPAIPAPVRPPDLASPPIVPPPPSASAPLPPRPPGSGAAPVAAADAPPPVLTPALPAAPAPTNAAASADLPPMQQSAPLPPQRPAESPPPAGPRVAALPPAESVGEPAPASAPTICPELSNGGLGVFTPSVVTATDPLCTVDRGVSLSAVRMKDGRLVELAPAAVLRCEMAASVATWLREKVDPAAATLGSPLDKVMVAASQQCRPRNRVAGAKISEHGRGNAIDLGGVVLADGRRFVIGPAGAGEAGMTRAFQETLRTSACADFTTILGPGSDGYHEEHLHLDRASRRSGAVLCQWDIVVEASRGPTTRGHGPH
ncbi:extensin family protein [Ancylobacter amanitiformis]|uniref:Extensin-like C-terminal domain-containing protein n=1 Tax=Ancylobacter amanitiformis TaxID=217069 RepID=A0ABU0LUL3_9HYPH|nr:extensin family protein [Ancylobacter amanitiformis]MDQ0512422.1 hypothetical protein [Ancylobacter amanitiformis]